MSKEGQDKIAQMVTDEIVAALDRGTVPWQQGWTARGCLPTSMSTGKPYRGVNPFLLAVKAEVKGYTSPFWGTYDRIAELCGMVKVGNRWTSPDGSPRGVRSGEKSTIVVFHKRIVIADDTADDGKRVIYMLRYYRVFNADQADGLPQRYYAQPDTRSDAERHADADAIIDKYLANGGPKLVKRATMSSPSYSPDDDTIRMPLDGQFYGMAERYSTTFHELTHSTGHAERLNRPAVAAFDYHGSEQYAKEELVAALGSSMLLAVAGLDANVESNAAYIAGWSRALKSDPKLIIQAAGQAWKAVDHIQGTTYEDAE